MLGPLRGRGSCGTDAPGQAPADIPTYGVGRGFPPAAPIEVHLSDPSSSTTRSIRRRFRERDLDPRAEEFITGIREIPHDKPVGLLIHVDKTDASAEQISIVRDAVRDYFAERASVTRQQLRLLFRRGRTSLVIGLVFLAGSIASGNVAAEMLKGTDFAAIARESLLIGGWVKWRPLEVFHDWWPIRAEARLFDRLSAMIVRVKPSARLAVEQTGSASLISNATATGRRPQLDRLGVVHQ